MRDLAVEVALEAGDWLRAQFGERIATTAKGEDSVVTELDVRSERLIAGRIRARYPGHTLIGEEDTPHEVAGERSWAIDPIDGTRNFAAGVPLWAVSIAALERGVPVAAAIYLPVTGEMYAAAEGAGATLNGRPLRVGETRRLSDAVVLTDLLARDYPRGLPGAALGGLFTGARRVRMLGSVCCALAYVAAGRVDLYYRPRAQVWDVAAGALLVREAGGEVRGFEGDPWRADSDSILAANPALVRGFLAEKGRLEGLHRDA
jgi:myo-inositol-1(or 4)-monophosphatase